MDNLESRVQQLESLCSRLDANVKQVETCILALQSGDKVLAVDRIYDGSVVVGYSIVFEKTGTITIYNGMDGMDGKDGKDGKDGNDGNDGRDGFTPQFKIVNGFWCVSYDGKNWEELGPASGDDGDSLFSRVYELNGLLYIELTTGDVFTIEIDPSLRIEFKVRDTTYVLPGQSMAIEFNIVTAQGKDEIDVEVIAQGDLSSELVLSPHKTTGVLNVTIGESIDKAPAKVLVFVSDGKHLIMKALHFVFSKTDTQLLTLMISGNSFTAPSFDGTETFQCVVSWGDGHVENYRMGLSHEYPEGAPYEVKIHFCNSDAFVINTLKGIDSIDLSGIL